MITEDQILIELKTISAQLKKQNAGAFRNFINGLFHSLGYFTGTILIFVILAVFASRYNWTAALSKSFETIMSQINWTKIVPTQKIEFTSPFSQP